MHHAVSTLQNSESRSSVSISPISQHLQERDEETVLVNLLVVFLCCQCCLLHNHGSLMNPSVHPTALDLVGNWQVQVAFLFGLVLGLPALPASLAVRR
jgi:hypothetical protein